MIRSQDVDRVFDASCIKKLGTIAKLPADTDLMRFGESVRCAVRLYVREAGTPSANQLRHEVEALHRAAERRDYESLRGLIGRMTPAARALLQERHALLAERSLMRPRRRRPILIPVPRIPTLEELADPERRDVAAEGLVALLEKGGMFKVHKRRSGKPTITLAPVLHAPPASRAQPRRAAERTLVMWLQVAAAEVAAAVPRTANRSKPGPAARMIAEVLVRAGAIGPHGAQELAVRLINDLENRRAN